MNFVNAVDSTLVISLTEASDGSPSDGDNVFVELGTDNQGNAYFYSANDTKWKQCQDKTGLNQQPLFDLFDNSEIKYSVWVFPGPLPMPVTVASTQFIPKFIPSVISLDNPATATPINSPSSLMIGPPQFPG